MNLSIHDNSCKKLIAENAPMGTLVFPPLIDALKSGTIKTRSNAAAALFTLSDLNSNKEIIGSLGALKQLIGLLEEGHPLAMKDVASAIRNLCVLQENKARATRHGAERVILKKIMDGMYVRELSAILAMLANNQMTEDEMEKLGVVHCLLSIVRSSSSAVNNENISIPHNIESCMPMRATLERRNKVQLHMAHLMDHLNTT